MKRKMIILLCIVFILFMTVLFVFYLMKGDASRWQVALGGIVVSGLPLGLLFLHKNPFNLAIIIAYYIFIFCTIYLGSIASFYGKYKWWDSTLHFFKGVLVGFIAFTLYKVLSPLQAKKKPSRSLIFLFVFSLAVTAGVLWEIYEFVGDLTVTHTMQRGGNKDTMYDLIAGTVGGLIAAIYCSIKGRTM